jgi:exonuclease SbcC
MTKADTLLAQMEKDQEQRTVRIRETQQKYESWLFQYNETHQAHLDENDVEKLLHYDQAWIESEEQALSALQLAYSNAVSICTDRQLNLAKHVESKVSELEEAEGNRQCQATEQEIEEKKKAINHIDFELQGDQQKRTMANQLLQQIDAQAAIVLQWSKLNELIGSADGKKFKLIAQAYTLDVLLGFANKHLVQLSKRYVLQRIPDTLGLLVIDQDMGDEQRGVYSLSGGESFLISLALALGLASLSANRVKVESLFIDEGFGSLDPETLNIAMDALESLHHQGRKVGVISHVQEMTERIPVQIQVSKQNNGKSKVRIFG